MLTLVRCSTLLSAVTASGGQVRSAVIHCAAAYPNLFKNNRTRNFQIKLAVKGNMLEKM
jgi:hypothetical protein